MPEKEMAASQRPAAAAKEAALAKEAAAAGRCVLLAQFCMAVGGTMALPARPGLVQAQEGGDLGRAARVLGFQSSCAAAFGLFLNPLLGSVSDSWGRRPCLVAAMLLTSLHHGLVAWAPASRRVMFLDRVVSGATIESFLALTRAALSDLAAGAALAGALARQGAVMGAGMVLGSSLGARLGGARAFACSAAISAGSACWLARTVPETHPAERRRPLSLAAGNPLAFLRLFKERRMAALAATAGLQSAAELSNILDMTFSYLRTVLTYGQAENGMFVTAYGLSRVAGGALGTALLKSMGQVRHILTSNAAMVLALAALGTARSSVQVAAALLAMVFGHQRSIAVDALMQKQGAAVGMGQGEVAAASANLLTVIRVMAPMLYGRLFSWATAKGKPGLPYFFVALLVASSQLTFPAEAP